MQPENQTDGLNPQAPQQPVPSAPQYQPVQQSAPQPQTAPAPVPPTSFTPVAPAVAPMQPPAPTPMNNAPGLPAQPAPTVAQAPLTPPTQMPVAEAIGSVAVADQVEGEYGYDDDDTSQDEGEIDLSQPVSWHASEYVHREKGAVWFIVFGVIFAVLLAVAILFVKNLSVIVLLVVIAAVIIILAKRPPRTIEYSLSNEGLHIDNNLHPFEEFKSFGVLHDGEEYSVMLIPRRRLMPGITVYFPEEAGEDIVDVLGSRMPMRDLHLDVIDRVVRKLRL